MSLEEKAGPFALASDPHGKSHCVSIPQTVLQSSAGLGDWESYSLSKQAWEVLITTPSFWIFFTSFCTLKAEKSYSYRGLLNFVQLNLF